MSNVTSIEQGLLEQSLQSMTETDNGGISAVLSFPRNFPAFEGHFPGQPVLPAVVQVAAVRLLAAKHLNTQLAPISLDRAKFKTMVGPDEPVTITISLDQSGNDVTISFSISTEQNKVSTGVMVCRVQH